MALRRFAAFLGAFSAFLLSCVTAAAAPGQIDCRYTAITSSSVNYYTCTELAQRYDIAIEQFFFLNPTVGKDCQNLKPNAEYCVRGFVAQAISTDGTCGPPNGNTTCLGTEKQCCNGETWKCGNSLEDCQPGTCHSGACEGFPFEYSMDGKCGYQNKGLKCGGKWGSCCNASGQCGSGEEFCGIGACQSGNCTIVIPTPSLPAPPKSTTMPPSGTSAPASPSKPSGVSTNGSCGGAEGLKCGGSGFGDCCSSSGYCGIGVDYCAQGCQTKFSSKCLTANIPSLNAECGPGKGGYTCNGGPFDGQCCSSTGFCGTTNDHCGAGCQAGYGKCK